MVPTLLDLLDSYAEIEIDALYVDRATHLMDEGIDVAIRIADLPDSGLSEVQLGSVRRVLCASPEYFSALGKPTTLSDLEAHQLIDYVNLTRNNEWNFVHDGKSVSMGSLARFRANNADAGSAAAVSSVESRVSCLT